MKNIFFATVLSLCLLPVSALAEAYGSGWYGEVQAAVLHEDNISRSFKDEDLVSDVVSSVSIGGGYSTKLGQKAQLVLTGYTTYHRHEEFDDLDHLATSLGFSWSYQPGAGYAAVWFGVAGNGTWLQYDDSQAREGAFFDLDLSINRRLSTRTVGHLGARYVDHVFVDKNEREENDHAAFDTAGAEVYLGFDFALARSTYLYTEYAFRHGGLTSTVSGLVPLEVDYAAETEDPVFDTCDKDDPGCLHRYAYRVVSDMHRVTLGLSWPFAAGTADLGASYLEAQGEEGGPTYEDWTVRLGLIWNF